MECDRCQGLMVGVLMDRNGLRGNWTWGWRCLNCGTWLLPFRYVLGSSLLEPRHLSPVLLESR
jgi:hypothetical protein